jgi:alpha-tubulin suppressor-like RCC1 family protein
MPTSRSSFGLQADGYVYAWGAAETTGTNSTGSVASPIQVVGAHRFITIEGSYEHTMGLKDNGQVWVWGQNTYGQFGTGVYGGGSSSPVQVVGSHSFLQIFSGYQCSAALKETGQVWTWGRNNYGQLGANLAAASISSPVQVVGNHSFVRVMGGSELFFGVKETNILWGWGRNDFGQLGDNTLVAKSSPVQVVGNHSFVQVRTSGYHCIAIKVDGTCWSWGVNSWGQLGTNNITNYSSPVQVVGNHSFIAIGAEYNGSSYGLKSDGQVWSWGYNNYGQLGTGNATNYSSPVQVVGSHSFCALVSSQYVARGLKSNGAIWSWGYNVDGRCGVTTGLSYQSPVLTVGPMSYTKLLSGMSVKVVVSGVWRKRPTIFVNKSGVWYKVNTMWILKNGVWSETDSLNK